MKTNSTDALALVKQRLDEAFQGVEVYNQEQARSIVMGVLCDAVIDGLVTPDFPAPTFEVDVTLQPEVRGLDIEIRLDYGPLSFEAWHDKHYDDLAIAWAESGRDRESCFDLGRATEDAYDEYVAGFGGGE